MSEYCPMCNGFEREIRRLNEQLSAANALNAKLWETVRAADAVHKVLPKFLCRSEQVVAYDRTRAGLPEEK